MTDKSVKLNQKEHQLFAELVLIIETGKKHVAIKINRGVVLIFWQVDSRVNDFILNHRRAEYGK